MHCCLYFPDYDEDVDVVAEVDYYRDYRRPEDAFVSDFTIDNGKITAITSSSEPASSLLDHQKSQQMHSSDNEQATAGLSSVPISDERPIMTAALPLLANSEDKMYRCRCGRNYSLLRNYNYHSRWECGRVHTCTKCGKTYKDPASYRKHGKVCSMV